MKEFEGYNRTAFLIYFATHIPITICIDAQAVFRSYYPQFFIDIVSWYCSVFGDILMKPFGGVDNDDENYQQLSRIWFSSLVCCEIIFQLPFFFFAIRIMMATNGSVSKSKSQLTIQSSVQQQHYPEWFRISCIIYASHVSTTLIPIISTFVMSEEMSIQQKCATIVGQF